MGNIPMSSPLSTPPKNIVDSAKESVTGAAYATSELASGFGRSNERRDNFTRPEVEPTNGCYIGNLLFDVTEEDLRREFEPFGTIKEVRLTRDARGLSKGFAYVEFETTEEATAAIEAKNQTVFEGRRLVVNYINRTPRSRDTNPPSKSLFIGNLAFEMSDADLNTLFRDIRNVLDVRVAIDRRTGQPRGFAHADFVDVESAVKAHEQLANKIVFDRPLRVDFSSGERNPGGRTGGAGGAGGFDRSRSQGSFGGNRGGSYGGDRGGRGNSYGGDRGGDRGGYGGRSSSY
ncbi:nucleic acid-binding protein [Rutstroemia sp. NJR-2017a WRK4]|nr:nucleic acid-binding protein [Rutstroemia sp. NJR-2017a WRK4]